MTLRKIKYSPIVICLCKCWTVMRNRIPQSRHNSMRCLYCKPIASTKDHDNGPCAHINYSALSDSPWATGSALYRYFIDWHVSTMDTSHLKMATSAKCSTEQRSNKHIAGFSFVCSQQGSPFHWFIWSAQSPRSQRWELQDQKISKRKAHSVLRTQ
jgi:hypothetical protein